MEENINIEMSETHWGKERKKILLVTKKKYIYI